MTDLIPRRIAVTLVAYNTVIQQDVTIQFQYAPGFNDPLVAAALAKNEEMLIADMKDKPPQDLVIW